MLGRADYGTTFHARLHHGAMHFSMRHACLFAWTTKTWVRWKLCSHPPASARQGRPGPARPEAGEQSPGRARAVRAPGQPVRLPHAQVRRQQWRRAPVPHLRGRERLRLSVLAAARAGAPPALARAASQFCESCCLCSRVLDIPCPRHGMARLPCPIPSRCCSCTTHEVVHGVYSRACLHWHCAFKCLCAFKDSMPAVRKQAHCRHIAKCASEQPVCATAAAGYGQNSGRAVGDQGRPQQLCLLPQVRPHLHEGPGVVRTRLSMLRNDHRLKTYLAQFGSAQSVRGIRQRA